MIVFRVHKAYGSEEDEYRRALDCAKSSIESVLSDFGAKAAVEGETISVSIDSLTEAQCKKMIAGCFCDRDGVIYPEFNFVEQISG